MKRLGSVAAILLIFLLPLDAKIDWRQVAQGVWKGIVGSPEDYSLLGVAGTAKMEEGFGSLPDTPLPLIAEEIVGNIQDGKTSLRFPLEKGEEIFGFGLNFKTVRQRGRIMRLHVDHYGDADNGRTHAPVPFYVSSLGYGVLINSSRYLTVYIGSGCRKDSPNAPEVKDRNTDPTWTATPYSDAVSILVPAPGAEIYIFAGPTAMDAVRRYNLFCGGGPIPPRWGLGFIQRTKSLYTDKDVINEIDEFERHGFPLDVIGLEPGWQSRSYPCTFEWDHERFPAPAQFVEDVKEKHVRLNLWTNPYVSPESGIYDQMYPLSGSHTVWCGIVPDFTLKAARDLWCGKLQKEHLDIGISGYKLDEVDGYDSSIWPDVATFPSGISAEQMRQTYGLWVQKITADLFHKMNKRTYGLVRGSNAGSVSFPYVIYSDHYAHRDFITALANSGFCGVLWVPEVRESKDAEEWIRRFQSVVFSPMVMINAWASGTKPWTYPEVEEYVREYAMLRMQMIPYLYSEFARYHFEGTPPFYSVELCQGYSCNHEVKDEYMAGQYLLVAPMFAGQKERVVVLPEGDWYDFYTGKFVGNGTEITVAPGLEHIPVFVRDGAVIPFMKPCLHAPESGEKVDIEVRHYGKSIGSFMLYDDDGETFDYENGEYSWREIKVSRDRKGRLKGTISKPDKGKPDNIGNVSWRFMTEGIQE